MKITDLSDFERGKIAGANKAGASVTEVTETVILLRRTISKVMTIYKEEEKRPVLNETIKESQNDLNNCFNNKLSTKKITKEMEQKCLKSSRFV